MRCEILSNVFLKERRLLLELAAPAGFCAASPGQFLHIRVEDSCDPLLRRPLSVHDCFISGKKNSVVVRVLYEVTGKGTALLSEKKPHSEVDCLGPLGSGFDLGKLRKCRDVYIVAGGMGVAPLFFLAKKMAEERRLDTAGRRRVKGPAAEAGKIILLIGARTKNDILMEREFRDLGCEVHVATEDGSRGFKGRVTELLKNCLALPRADRNGAGAPLSAAICACGPKPMLSAVSGIARNGNIPAQVSLEEFMGCGLGACLGCVIRTTSGYKRICHDGPVFDSSEIIWKD